MKSAADMNFVMAPEYHRQSEWNVTSGTNTADLCIRHKARYDFIEFVRPTSYHSYTVEQQFGVLRWMVERAHAINPTKAETGRWGVSGPLELLSKKPSCVNHSGVDPIGSLDDLRERFHYALLSQYGGPSVVRWMSNNGICITGKKVIHFPHYAPFAGAPLQGKLAAEGAIRDSAQALLTASGRLTTQLNSFYADAVEIYGVPVKVLPNGFQFVLQYGVDGSIWYETLAATPNMWEGEGETFRYLPYGRDSEPFIGTLDRAITRLKELTK